MTNFIIIFLQIVIGLLSAYLLFYAQQKGKNLADKGDLKKLTEIVEEVKRKNVEEIELLKANLRVLAEKEKQIFNEEKEAIINFYSQLNKWIWDRLNIHLNEYNQNNYKELSDRLISMRDAYNQTNVFFAKVQLICKNDDLITAGHNAIIETLRLHQFKETLVQRLERALSSGKILLDQLSTDGKFDMKKFEALKEFYTSQAKDNEQTRNAVWKEYLDKHQAIFKAALGKMKEFEIKAKVHLNT